MTIDEFKQQVLYFCCGDDMIYATRSDCFEPVRLSDTYAKVGVFLEFETEEPHLGTFVGATPAARSLQGAIIPGYCGRSSKFLAVSHFKKRGRTDVDFLAKLCSLAQLSFFDEHIYSIIAGAARRYAEQLIIDKKVNPFDSRVGGLLSSIGEGNLLKQYLGLEARQGAFFHFAKRCLRKADLKGLCPAFKTTC